MEAGGILQTAKAPVDLQILGGFVINVDTVVRGNQMLILKILWIIFREQVEVAFYRNRISCTKTVHLISLIINMLIYEGNIA